MWPFKKRIHITAKECKHNFNPYNTFTNPEGIVRYDRICTGCGNKDSVYDTLLARPLADLYSIDKCLCLANWEIKSEWKEEEGTYLKSDCCDIASVLKSRTITCSKCGTSHIEKSIFLREPKRVVYAGMRNWKEITVDK